MFKHPIDGREFVKRVVGLPGDRVEVRGRQVYINNKPAAQTFMIQRGQALLYEEDLLGCLHEILLARGCQGRRSFGPAVVPAGHLFVLGDNRDRSYDSRAWGFVPLASVEGRLVRRLTGLR